MNKPQLIELINKLPDDIDIPILSAKDDEGNGYRWISDISLAYVHKSEVNDYEIEMVCTDEDLEELANEWDDENIADDYTPVAVIW